ncbi:shikimate dehydrogenase [Halalkalibacter kiskunsagensis]|uniref:Shikimate dehydrogenase (NADP(+)) n=1 Tax=Halalkalibacter kiskunsagensis TaxID=1548599 RepID=A0ABV6KJB4_9BACI
MEKVYGLLGHPIGHSMSPLIHNDAFLNVGIKANYQAFDVEPQMLGNAIKGIKALGIAGCNVTVPHKIAVMNFLDEVDEEAKLIGAVNTIVNQNGKLIGHNTDGRGYVQSLIEETNEEIINKRFLIIGAGGAARGVITALLRHGIEELTITNRTQDKIEPLLELANLFQTPASRATREEVERNLDGFDVLINTTSVGMSPRIEDSPLSLNNLRAGAIASDLIYNPLKTKFLKEAEERGGTSHTGIGMFVNQAALSFEHWTGIKPDHQRMRKLVLDKLGGTKC